MAIDKLIIFGGSFNPIHNGHLKSAAVINKILEAPVFFLPNIVPPYKSKLTATPIQRLEMLQLAIKSNPNFAVNTLELFADEYYYTHKTLTLLRSQYGSKVPFYFILGFDSLINLNTWEYYHDIFNLTNLIVINRHGYNYNDISDTKLKQEILNRQTNNFEQTAISGNIYLLSPDIYYDVSSTQIRAMIKAGENIVNLVPPEVALYIKNNNLYLT
ncbi:MAG: Nicotinate-nucleotide adenylyltransferase [Pseudomonadota bacterium]|jgi:nicotinate-nucleotide adenylyltransferase|nr:nicotinate (nicotinamide) nucleotide adenylyltransferase [Burkholderiales bacterium]